MFEGGLHFEGGQSVVIDGATFTNLTCGPIRTEPEDGYDGSVMVSRRKIIGAKSDLPSFVGREVDIDGLVYEVEEASSIGEIVSVTYVRNLG